MTSISAIDSLHLVSQHQPQPKAPGPSRPPSSAQRILAQRLQYSRVGSVVAAVLIVAGSGLDYFAYPERLEEFIRLRWIAAIALLGVWGLMNTALGARLVRSASIVWLAIPQLMIAWMIHDTSGAESSYFAGLLLALYAVGTVLPVTVIEGTLFGAFTLLVYVAACLLQTTGMDAAASASFFTHCLFIVLSAITATICAWLNEKSRNRLVALKDEVSSKNAELLEVNHTLSQIKGQLMEREKMASMGVFSTGLVQELNNPVNASLMSIDQGLGMSAVRGDKMLRESLQDARAGMERVRTIASDLRTFAYPTTIGETPKAFALEKAMRSAIRLASFDLKGVSVSIDTRTDTLVMGDEPALIGVLINLLSCAAQAIKTIHRPHPQIRLHGEMKDGRVRISVRDNGPGINRSAIDKVFEPFFVIHSIGSGLGLGLSLSQAIVQRHGSELTVQSEPGAWTEFSFELATP